MQLQEKWDEDIILHNIEYLEGDHDSVEKVLMSFMFFKNEFLVTVNSKYIQKDEPFITMEGPSKLFSSFEDLLEGDYWPKVKEAFRRYEKWYKEKIEQQNS